MTFVPCDLTSMTTLQLITLQEMSPISPCEIIPLGHSGDHLLEDASVDIVAVNNGFLMTDPHTYASVSSIKPLVKQMNRQPPQGGKQAPMQVRDCV